MGRGNLAMVEVKVEQRRRGVGRGGGGALEGGEEAIWPAAGAVWGDREADGARPRRRGRECGRGAPSARGDGEDGVDEDAPREPHLFTARRVKRRSSQRDQEIVS